MEKDTCSSHLTRSYNIEEIVKAIIDTEYIEYIRMTDPMVIMNYKERNTTPFNLMISTSIYNTIRIHTALPLYKVNIYERDLRIHLESTKVF